MEQIMYDSDEAAKFVTDIKGWVDSKGFFYGNNPGAEGVARYAGCTHRACEKCGKPALKLWTVCPECKEKSARKRYLKRELVEWDGKTPVYSEVFDRYFFDKDSLNDFFVTENRPEPERVRLLLCEPSKLPQIDYDYWDEHLPEDGELPEDVKDALDKLNKCLRESKIDYWFPGELRVSL